MGAGSSVGTDNDAYSLNKEVKNDDVDNHDSSSASPFDVFANLLASAYHNHRLSGVGDPSLMSDDPTTATTPATTPPTATTAATTTTTTPPVVGAVSPLAASVKRGLARVVVPSLRSKPLPPPLPRAERKRLSRQQLRYVVDGEEEGIVEKKQGRGESVQVAAPAAAAVASSLDKGRSNNSTVGPARSQKMESLEIDELIATTNTKRELPGKGHGQFVERGEMVVLARDLGHDISLIQATRLFDMLDPVGEGRIAKGDLLRHSIPLLQRVEHCGPTEKRSGTRRGSTIKPPRRPRPTCPPPQTAAAPSRPSGEPPPTAKRWLASAFYGDRRASAATTLPPVLPSNVRKKRPANFWVAARGAKGDVARSRRSFDGNGGGQVVGCYNGVDDDLDRGRQVSAGGSTNVNMYTEGVDQTEVNGQTERANREATSHGGGIVRAEGGTRADKGGDVVVVATVVPAAPTREGSEGEGARHRKSEYGEGTRRSSPDDSCCGIDNVGCHSTSNEPLAGRSRSREAAGTGHSTSNEPLVARSTSAAGSPDDGCGINNTGCHSTPNEPLVRRSTTGMTAETGHSTSNKPLVGRSTSEATAETGEERRRMTTTTAAVATPARPSLGDALAGKDILTWTAADVRVWLRALPRGLAAFAEAEAFSDESVDGKRLATLTLSDLKKKEFHHAMFRAKVPTALWVEIKRIQPVSSSAPAVAAVPVSSRFSAGQTIADEAARTPLCTVTQFVGQGAFGEVYKVVWTGVGADWGATLAMKTVRLADITSHERDEYRVLLVEEILTAVRVKPHPNVVNVRLAHIMGFCSENEEYLCFEDFVTGTNLGSLVLGGRGELYNGTTMEVQGRLLSYAIQLARGLGHIHRCGVLHQDIKSENVMVSEAGQMLITDFGFATVGHFGPPPQRPVCAAGAFPDPSAPFERATTLVPATICAKLDTGLAGGEPIEEDVFAVPTDRPVSSMDSAVPGDSRKPLGSTGLIADDIDHRTETTKSSGEHISKKREGGGGDTEGGGVVGESQANKAGFGLVSAGKVQEREDAKIEVGKRRHLVREPKEEKSHLVADCTTVNKDDAGTGTVVQAVKKVEQRGGDIGTVPGLNCVLFGTLKGFTPRYQSPEVSRIMERKANSLKSQAGAGIRHVQSGVAQDSTALQAKDNVVDGPPHYTHRSDMWAAGVLILEMYAGGLAALPAGCGENACELLEILVESRRSDDFCPADGVRQDDCTIKTSNGRDDRDVNVAAETGGRLRAGGEAGGIDVGGRRRRRNNKLRVDMPEEVLKLVREMFEQEPRDRPVSMEAVAARLSLALDRLLEKNMVTVPCPSPDAPSPSSLCEQAPACPETEENHAKLGRLHMWLGKALFLKGEDRRGQALQEYREGVKVLEESKADQGSPSMALFRWYLGKALLEAGEIEEALPHLTEAVSIDPENAKYRHTLGLAKCATGDEAGAREDLLEAALLDEEDAEDRYQLRMQRASEARKTLEKHSQGQEDSEEGARQGSTSPRESDTLQAVRIPTAGAPSTSLRYGSHLQALGYASSPQGYTLERLMEYRTGRGGVVGLGDIVGIARGTVDAGAMALGEKGIRDGGLLSEARHFSVGDQIMCGKDESAPVKATDPLRCYPSTLDRAGGGGGGGGGGTYAIDGFLSGEQASLCFRGEAYTATTRHTSSEDDTNAGRSYHLVRMGFAQDSRSATLVTSSTSAATTARSRCLAAPALAIDEGLNTAGTGKNTDEVPDVSSGRVGHDSARQPSEPSRALIGPTCMRSGEYIPALRAVGRAAMVGFHTGLAGALHDITWGSGELVLVAKNVPGGCLTLREALCGSLYRGSSIANHGVEEQSLGVEGVTQRILTIARQTAAAISHCHRRGVLLQDITPSVVRVTRQWNALLRPNYAHAREGRAWTTVSVREPPPPAVRSMAVQRKALRPQPTPLSSGDDEPLTAPFSDTTRPGYQSPEIAQIRRASPPHVRVSGRALRQSRLSPPPEQRREKTPPSSPSLRSTRPESASSKEGDHGHKCNCIGDDGGGNNSTDNVVAPRGGDKNGGGGGGDDLSTTTTPVQDKQGGAVARVTSRRGNYARDGDLSPPGDSSSRGFGGKDVSSLGVPTGSSGLPTVTPRTSDIWAWALIVLEMFSDDGWPPDSGQEGLLALEALLRRRTGVHTWTTEDVVSWLRDVGLWSENTEREIRAFNIDGRQLLIPTCRRDIIEKLGLFITDGELSHKLWKSIAGGLQRKTMPPQLARILRRCLADHPEARFSTMEEVCTMLEGVTTDRGGGGRSTVPTASSTPGGDDDRSLDRLRTGMILNNTALCSANEGDTEEAERHYKMALLASEEIPEVHYNLGLLYSTAAFNKFREAQQSFEAAARLMDADDPRRRASSDHARAAERKSNFYQSEQVMNALSGKYNNNSNSVSPAESRGTTRTAREPRGSEDGDGRRRSSTTPEAICSPPWNSSTTTRPTGLLSPKGSGFSTTAAVSHRPKTTRKSSPSPL